MAHPRLNISNRNPATEGLNRVEVYSQEDFGSVSVGVGIDIIPDTNFVLMAPITQTEPFLIGTGESIQITTASRFDNAITYTNATEAQFQGTNIGTLALFDVVLNGNSTATAFDINGGVLSLKFPDFNRYNDLGTVQNLVDFFVPGAFFDVIAGGIILDNCSSATIVDSLILGLDGNTFAFFRIFGASSGDIQILDNIMENDSSSYFLYVDSLYSTSNTVTVTNNNIVNLPENFYDPLSITALDNRLLVRANKGVADSVVSAEANLVGNVATTNIPAAGAIVFITGSGWTGEEESKISVDTGGDATYTGNTTSILKLDGNVSLEPSSSTKLLACRFVLEKSTRNTVTFTNGTNLINETGTARVNGDVITFNSTAGTLPAELREDIVYYVVNAAVNDFQVSYTEGGAVVAFTDDGTPTNTYAPCELHGSIPTNSIAANNPRGLVPQALENAEQGDISHLTVTNLDDAVNILVTDAYFRIFN